MSAENHGGPAFPVADPFAFSPGTEAVAKRLAEGMTLRDYFAGQVLIGLASAYHEHWTVDRVAEVSYELADRMLAERAK